MAYSKILRRIRDEKTNYSKRTKMLMGHSDFITVQISNQNTQIQIHKPKITGDLGCFVCTFQFFRAKKGWKGSS